MIRTLDYLEAVAPLVDSVRGFTSSRLAYLLTLAVQDREALLDKRAELEVLRALHNTHPSGLEWVSETERGVKPDIRLVASGTLVNLEVSRLRASCDEAIADKQRRRIEKAITSRAFPFDIVVFLDVSCGRAAVDPGLLVGEAGSHAMEFAERLSRDQDRVSELVRLHSVDQLEREEALRAYVLNQLPDAAPDDVLKGLLKIEMRPKQAKCEEQLVHDGDPAGTVTAYYVGEGAGSCTIHVFGPMPDATQAVWTKVTDECRQLPPGAIGVIVLWVDRQADLLDLYSPIGYATKHGVEWVAELETLFSDYKDRCSGIVFMSGFERELVANPLADCLLEPELAQGLARDLQLRTWGYLILRGHHC